MTISVLTATGTTGAGGGSYVSPSFTSTSGSTIVVIYPVWNTSGAAANGDITDAKSNTYTLATSSFGGAFTPGIAAYYNIGGTRGASHTVTANLVNTSSEDGNIAVIEFSAGGAITYISATAATSTDASSPYGVTAAAAITGTQIAIYGTSLDTGANVAFTQPSGYTNIHNNGNGASAVSDAAYKIGETGTPTVGATSSHAPSAARNILVTFQEAAGSFIAPSLLHINQTVNRSRYF